MISSSLHLGATAELVPIALPLSQAVKHGLVLGATGSGKTVSVQVLAEGFSAFGVPVVMTDAKGDLSGLARPAAPSTTLEARLHRTGSLPRSNAAPPVQFRDVFGLQGHPFGIPARQLGLGGFSRILQLSPSQGSSLAIAFDVIEQTGLSIDDLVGLRHVLNWMGRKRGHLAQDFGQLRATTLGTLSRQLATMQAQGADKVIRSGPNLLDSLIQRNSEGAGLISLLSCQNLVRTPTLYAGMCHWLLNSLYEKLPEQGAVDQPTLIVIIDEAHLLFRDAPGPIISEIERVIRLIRSRGVGVFLASQSPSDIPRVILGQLGNRIVHALRGMTPADRQALRAIEDSLAFADGTPNKGQITSLETGTAIVSMLGEDGAPRPAARTVMRPPGSMIGALAPADLQAHLASQRVGHEQEPFETHPTEICAKLDAWAERMPASEQVIEHSRPVFLSVPNHSVRTRSRPAFRAGVHLGSFLRRLFA